MKMIYPVDIAVRQFYHVYVEAQEDASKEEVELLARKMVVEQQEECLCSDNDIDIEDHDISIVKVRDEDAWSETEEEEIVEIMRKLFDECNSDKENVPIKGEN